MSRLFSVALWLFALIGVAQAKATDPCGVSAQNWPTAQLRLERDIAIYIAKHTQRACREISDFERGNPILVDQDARAKFGAIADKLRRDILEPIYNAYPELRGQDLTARSAGIYDGRHEAGDKAKTHTIALTEAQFGETSASYIHRVVTEANHMVMSGLTQKAGVVGRDKEHSAGKKWGAAILDTSMELSFAASPCYWRAPGLLHADVLFVDSPRLSKEATEQFRKWAPPVGSVRLSPGALAHVRTFYDSVRKGTDGAGDVIDISWVEHMGSKGPEDKEWTEYPPHVGLGGWSRRRVPADVIRYFDGIPIVFGGDTRERFAGKLIDYDGKNLVIKTQ